MLNKASAYMLIDKVLSYCSNDTMVSIFDSEKGLTRFTNSQIHQNVQSSDTMIQITVSDGKREASVTTNLVDDESLQLAVKNVEENLLIVPEGDILLPQLTSPAEICNEEVDASLESSFDIIKRVELIKAGIEALSDGFTAAGALSLDKTAVAMGNSKGIKRYHRQDLVKLNVLVTHESGSSGYAAQSTNKTMEMNILRNFKVAYDKAKAGINPISIEPGSYTVILEPAAVANLLMYMSISGFSAKSVQTGRSFLTGKLGERVFGENITITDDVTNSNTIPSYFDTEGYERKKVEVIKNGVANQLIYDTKSAACDGVETTGHSVSSPNMGGIAQNIVMEAGRDSFDDMIKNSKKAILVTRFHYMNTVNPRQALLTALTRDGLFLVEDGEIKTGIKNMRFTESLLEAFNNVTAISAERTKVPSFAGVSYVPALKIENFHFTGKTE